MIVNKKPKTETIHPLPLQNVLYRGTSTLYRIENNLQRNFVWNVSTIDSLLFDIKYMLKYNISKFKDTEYYEDNDYQYVEVGDFEISELDTCNKLYNYDNNSISNTDGSQRTRILLCLLLAFLTYKSKINNDEYVNLTMIKNKDGVYKYNDIRQEKIGYLYNLLENNKIDNIIKKRNKNISYYVNNLDNVKEKNIEDVYFYCTFFVENNFLVDEDLSNLDKCIEFFGKNIILMEKTIPKEKKVKRFIDINSKGIKMSDEDIYNKILINSYGEENIKNIEKYFNIFEDNVKKCEKNKTYINTKNGIGCMLYVMIEALKLIVYNNIKNVDEKSLFVSNFDLKNYKYGIMRLIDDKLYFNTYNDVIDYYKICSNITEFINTTMSFNNENKWYIMRNYSGQVNHIWWHFIKPCYIHNNILNEDKKDFIYNILLKTRYFYIIGRCANTTTNSQSFINFLEEISFLMLKYNDISLDEFKKIIKDKIKHFYQLNGNNWETLKVQLTNLNYDVKSHKTAIYNILSLYEYYIIYDNDLKYDTFYNLFYKEKKNSIDIDHIKPKSHINSENINFINKIGNLTLLESNLNRSKGNIKNNTQVFCESNIYTTRFLNKDSIGSNVSVNQRSNISKNKFIKRYDNETLNSFNENEINERTNLLADFTINYFKEGIYE